MKKSSFNKGMSKLMRSGMSKQAAFGRMKGLAELNRMGVRPNSRSRSKIKPSKSYAKSAVSNKKIPLVVKQNAIYASRKYDMDLKDTLRIEMKRYNKNPSAYEAV